MEQIYSASPNMTQFKRKKAYTAKTSALKVKRDVNGSPCGYLATQQFSVSDSTHVQTTT